MATQQEQERSTANESSASKQRSQDNKQRTRSEGETQSLTQASRAAVPERGESRPERSLGPFSMMRRFSDEFDRMFDDLFTQGLSRVEERWPLLGWPERWGSALSEQPWRPTVEVYERDNKLIVQADVPGLKKDDIKLEVHDSELRISGERHSESERKERGYHLSERSYGAFSRTIPLPEGAKPDTASATFEQGVLRIEMEAPSSQQSKGRTIEIREGAAH